MAGRKYPVFCCTDPEKCGPDPVFLGYARLGEILKCPRCGRHTAPGFYSWKLSEWKDKKKYKGDY